MKNNKIKTGVLYLCYCPDWCELEYQIAKWNGNKFYYQGQSNDDFDSYVHSFELLRQEEIDMNRYERA